MTTVKEIADEIVALQSRKNADYGNAFGISMQEFGLTVPAIRLTDKLNRFKSLIKKEAEVKSESIEDTLIDLAAYAMMTVAEMRNGQDIQQKQKPEIINVVDDDLHPGDSVRVIWLQYSQAGKIGKVQSIYKCEEKATATVSFSNGELASFDIEALEKI